MIDGGVAELTRFSTAIRTPLVVLESLQVATTMAASGAMALATSASRSASPSAELVPGLVQVEPPLGCVVVTVPDHLLRKVLR